jgi:seryl-tRNA synthetase
LHEHAARLKELEQRLTHAGVLLEQERDRCLQLNNHADSLKSELQQLNAANATLQEHMQSLGHAERMVAELSVRMSELADANRDLTAQLNVKTAECGQHQETIHAINREKVTMAVCVDRYERVSCELETRLSNRMRAKLNLCKRILTDFNSGR